MRPKVVVEAFVTQSKIREVIYAIGTLLGPHQEVGEVLFVCKAGSAEAPYIPKPLTTPSVLHVMKLRLMPSIEPRIAP